ncbi:class I SAM-dependent methyltransferase [Kaistia dalseonensis]|uniref:SAM-dependent methyltransferase n=1 Tax=Kaistia dalseonensis TaxID=410840 RepID=A0ABU0H7J7_9HYPH|nr:class I SAM-dependent methyltransferase [Kaistia dalseonensis]MCX5495678.1 class I SAM-dependent methyltransferase [Kaistia dalseonensis]MDQ0438273.1 SAM-dependent methyltransferase [Kaistia dalseonensis]
MSATSVNEGVLQTYQSLYSQHGDDPASLGVRATSQPVRFQAVTAALGSQWPDTIVDLGCGFGDLLSHLRGVGWKGHYTGVDFMTEFVDIARQRFEEDPAADFLVGDATLIELPPKSFDVCISLGLCNHQRGAGTISFIEALIGHAASLVRQSIFVDFLSATSNRRRDDLYFMDAGKAIQIGLQHSNRVKLDHTYMPFEFLLTIRLDDQIQPGLPFFSD